MKKPRIKSLRAELLALQKHGRVSVILNVVPLWEHPHDERFERGISEYLWHAGAYAMGYEKTSSSASQCFCCTGEWSNERGLSGFITLEFTTRDGTSLGSVSGICRECWGDSKLLNRAVRRDFGIEMSQARPIQEGGHA